MDDTILIKRGDTTGVSFLTDGELGYSKEEKALYIGDGGRRNQKLCSAETAEKVEAFESEKLSATPAESQASLGADTTLAGVINAYNSLIASLKASGIMKEG